MVILGKGAGEPVDLVFGSLLGDGYQEAIVEFWVPLTEWHTGEESGIECVGQELIDAALSVADDELF